MASLQRAVGNRATTELISRVPHDSSIVVARDDGRRRPAATPPAARAAAAIRNRNVDEVGRIEVGSLPVTTRLQLMQLVLDSGVLAYRAEVTRIWRSFGASLPDVAAQHAALWRYCARFCQFEPGDFAVASTLRTAFPNDVRQLAITTLETNKTVLQGLADQLGIYSRGSPAAALARVPRARREQFRRDMLALEAANQARRRLRSVAVGLGPANFSSSEAGSRTTSMPLLFDPEHPPPAALPDGPSWADLKRHDDGLRQAAAALRAQFDMSGGRADLAMAVLDQGLSAAIGLLPRVRSGDLEWFRLTPVARRLMSGQASPSSTRWHRPFEREIARSALIAAQGGEASGAIAMAVLGLGLALLGTILTGGLGTAVALLSVAVDIAGVDAAGETRENVDMADAVFLLASRPDEVRMVDRADVTAAHRAHVASILSLVVGLGTAGVNAGVLGRGAHAIGAAEQGIIDVTSEASTGVREGRVASSSAASATRRVDPVSAVERAVLVTLLAHGEASPENIIGSQSSLSREAIEAVLTRLAAEGAVTRHGHTYQLREAARPRVRRRLEP